MSEDFKEWADFFGDPDLWKRELVPEEELKKSPECPAWERYKRAIMKAYGVKAYGE